jgi:MATE family multidrug resistance protein
MGRIGSEALAAHQIALNVASGSFHLVMGLGTATGIMVGQEIGAGRPEDARQAGFTGVLIGVVFMAFSAALYLGLADEIARLFTGELAVILPAAALLHVAGFFQISDGIQVVAQGALRGAGDTAMPFAIQTAAHWLVGLPLGLFLAHPMGMGAPGLWWGLTGGLTVAAALLLVRFARRSGRGFVALQGEPSRAP